MARQKQTRRSISVKGLTHQRLKKYCDANKMSVASFVEEVIAEKLGEPTDEDRRKFGELIESGDKGSEAAQTAQDEPHEPQEALPDPPTPDEPREGAPEPARKPVIEPIPKPESEPDRQPIIEPIGKPELPRDAAPAPEPESEPEPYERPDRKRPLSKGTPLEKREKEPEEEAPELEGYVPPILEF